MSVAATPFRWPKSWIEPAAVDLFKGTAIDFLWIADDPKFDRVRARARELGIQTGAAAPLGVTVVEGAWPGVKSSRGGGDGAEAGPTGVPWVDSNGWLVRLTRAKNPDAAIWVEAPPKDRRMYTPASYTVAVADVAAHGGKWIIQLDDALAAQFNPENAAWKRIVGTAKFFAARPEWAGYPGAAVLGVVSGFAGENEFMGQELLNLLARAGMNYRIVLKERPDFAGLRAVLYADKEAPPAVLRKAATAFAEAGGLLITTPVWGKPEGRPSAESHPAFDVRIAGKGRVATTRAEPDDPWVLANDSVVLISHRNDLVRCFNSGSFGSYYTVAPGGKQAIVHAMFYSDRGPTEASIRVAGPWRSAKLWTVDEPAAREVKTESGKGWIEAHLPAVPNYVALELSA
jgi:hypothetical protein